MSHRLPITIRLESFEGPLDLLLYLIQSHEMDVSKVAISRITDQYLGYVRLMQELNFDIASEFLVMAATLVQWKSRALLPKENENDDAAASDEDEISPEELVRQLLEHQRFKAAGADLAQLPRLNEDVFTRHNKRPPIERIWKEISVTDLSLSYQDFLVRARKRTQVLKKETVSLTDKIREFGTRLALNKPTEMSRLLSPAAERPEVVVTFLASLELSRLKKMKLHQERAYEEIYMELIDTLANFDPDLATGFEAAQMDQPKPKFDLERFEASQLNPDAPAEKSIIPGELPDFVPGAMPDSLPDSRPDAMKENYV